jgi:phage-related protein
MGDGYEQRAPDGINNLEQKWSLRFETRTTTEANAITSFLETQAGVVAFDWTAPDGTVGKWVCQTWNKTPSNFNNWSVAAVFERRYE